ncbi:MAG TPA: universal stress protein [Planctomycetaceae bacterium]|nr:universal stress protein [Planctomycetaceae bacterium]
MSWVTKKCVVVPFDFSDESVKALEAAPEFVDDLKNIHVIHVLFTIIAGEPGMSFEALDNEARRRDVHRAFRERFKGTRFADLDFCVRFGDAGHEIASYAEQLGAEFIVMPSHGRTGLTRLLLGSVAEKVVRLAPCPVLILK